MLRKIKRKQFSFVNYPILFNLSFIRYFFLFFSSSSHPFFFLLFAIVLKTESTRKLSNFNFQSTKTLYQNNSINIKFFFTFFKGLRCNKSSVVTLEKSYLPWWNPKPLQPLSKSSKDMPQFFECTGKKSAPNNAIQVEGTLYHAVGDRGQEMESSKIKNQSILHCQVETAHAPVCVDKGTKSKGFKDEGEVLSRQHISFLIG